MDKNDNTVDKDDECYQYNLEDCPFTLAELGVEENRIEYGTPEGVIEYLRQKGEL